MSDRERGVSSKLRGIMRSEEAIYGLILISGLIVASGSASAASLDALITVLVTVIVFFAAHVYAGTLGRFAATDGHSDFRVSVRAAGRHSSGMLVASVPSTLLLILGSVGMISDAYALWLALIANAVLLGVLGWIAVARWNHRWMPRVLGALGAASFGLVLILLKAVVNH